MRVKIRFRDEQGALRTAISNEHVSIRMVTEERGSRRRFKAEIDEKEFLIRHVFPDAPFDTIPQRWVISIEYLREEAIDIGKLK